LILFIFAVLVFFFPVASYLLFLAILNARTHPTIISGPWDFVGVLFATSGFLLIGGPVSMTAFHNRWRVALLQGDLPGLLTFRGELGDFAWLGAWVVYFLVVIGGSAFLLWQRRHSAVVYNVEPPVLDDALAHVCQRLKLESVRVGNRILIRPSPETAQAMSEFEAGAEAAQPSLSYDGNGDAGTRPGFSAGLELDPFPTMRHVTLRWRSGDRTLRRDVEAELGRLLAEVETPDSPVAGWFLTVSSCIFGGILLALVMFILFLVKSR